MDDYDSFYEKYSDDINNKMKKVIEDFSVDRCIDYNLFDDHFEDCENWDSTIEYKKIHEVSYSKLSNEEFVIEMFYYEAKNNEIFNLNRIYYLYVMDKIDIKAEVKKMWEYMKKYSHLTADEMYDIYCNGENDNERFWYHDFVQTFFAYLKLMGKTELIYSDLNENLMKYYNNDEYRCLFSDFKLIKENDKEYFNIDKMIRTAEDYKILDWHNSEDYSKKIIISRVESQLMIKKLEDKYSNYNHSFMGLMYQLTSDYCNETSKKLLKKM